MVRAPLAKSVEEDLDDDDEEDDETDDAQQQQPSHPQPLRHQQAPGGFPNATANKYQRRRSSIVGATRTDELSDALSVMEAGDDKSLRPRYLKERSATHAELSVGSTEPLTVPQSKAGAFLLSVMAKARGYNLYDMRRAPFDPHRNASTNNLSYANRKKEQGVPLRMASSSTRRLGVVSSVSSRSLLGDQGDEHKADGDTHEQRSMVALVQELGLHRQQIGKQLDTLHEVLQRLTDLEHDHQAQAQLCRQLVDASFVREVVLSLREFRFHVGLQMCVIGILSVLAEHSGVYAYAMSENEIEIILQKAMAVHVAHERLMVTASTLLHAISESKTAANARAYKDSEAAKTKQRKATFAEAVAVELALKLRHSAAASGVAAMSPSRHRLPRQQHAQLSASGESHELEQQGKNSQNPDASDDGGEDACDLAERSRVPSRSGSRLRRALAADVAPPVLSASYNLQFAKKREGSSESRTLDGTNSPSLLPPAASTGKPAAGKIGSACGASAPFAQLRPMSSPARTFTSASAFHLTSDSLAVVAYAGAPLFVEPSPLSKRMASRGISSANGLRRRLHFKKRPPQRIPTPLVPVCADSSNDCSGQEDEPMRAREENPTPDKNSALSPAEPATASSTATYDANEDDEEDAYEDDFADDSEPGTGRLADAEKLESDAELIDLLHDLPLQDASPTTPASQQQRGDAASADALRRIQTLYSQGLMHQKENQLELAVAAYEAALQVPASGREFASLHINLGSAQMTQLRFAEALASFERAERIHPTNAKAAYNCALALMHLDRAADAEEQFRKVLALDPAHAKARHALSQLGSLSGVVLLEQ